MPGRGRRQTLFVLLIGVYLTLVCPGHDHGGEHSAPHLAFLGEPDEALAAPVPAASQRLAGLPFGPGLIGLTAANLAETLGQTVADVALTSARPAAPTPPLRAVTGDREAGQAQVSLCPAHPPPRPA